MTQWATSTLAEVLAPEAGRAQARPAPMPERRRWARTDAVPRFGTTCSSYQCGGTATVLLRKPNVRARRAACARCAAFLTGEAIR